MFLSSFLGEFAKYKGNDFYVFGESYAGHYVPAVSHAIYTANKQEDAFRINLQGLSIGNGLTDASIQYKWYPEMAYNRTSNKVVSKAQYEAMHNAVPTCTRLIKACLAHVPLACTSATAYCNSNLVSPMRANGYNVYDVREKCPANLPLCYDFSAVDEYLGRQSVRDALGIPSHVHWEQCATAPHMALTGDW